MDGTSEFWKAVNNMPPRKKVEIIYKAYVTNGKVTSAMSGPIDNDWPEGGIEISAELYKDTSLLYRCKLINGKLVQVKQEDPRKLQLEQSKDGQFISLPDNIIFAAEEGDNYIQKEYNVKISNNGK